MAQPAIELRDLRVQYEEERILDGVSLSVAPGEFVCLMGPSGCGKTTLLRAIGGLAPTASGEIRILGEEPDRGWRNLAYVFQSPRLVPWRTALGNVLLGMELRGDLDHAERRSQAEAALAAVGLDGAAHKYPAVLSGGEAQRVALARALALDPGIILMDEPLSSLDDPARLRLRDEILRIWQRTGKTILFVTHDAGEACALADRVIVLSDKPARVAAEFAVNQPRPRTAIAEAALAPLRDALRAAIGAAGNGAGVRVAEAAP